MPQRLFFECFLALCGLKNAKSTRKALFRALRGGCPKSLEKHSARHCPARAKEHSCKWRPGSQAYTLTQTCFKLVRDRKNAHKSLAHKSLCGHPGHRSSQSGTQAIAHGPGHRLGDWPPSPKGSSAERCMLICIFLSSTRMWLCQLLCLIVSFSYGCWSFRSLLVFLQGR